MSCENGPGKGLRHADYKPPFIWFGGKSAVAERVWAGLGDVLNYVEPFFGSGAVLFLRPDGAGHIETVNDADALLANFWRSLQLNPDAVAKHADWPVSECEIHAHHLWLLGEKPRIAERIMGDPEFYDAKAAGWWVHGLCSWIGSGWCSGKGPWVSENGVMVLRNPGKGVNRQLPHLGDPGQGVNRQLPHLGDPGQGVNRQLPHLRNPGKEPSTGNGECAARSAWLRSYLQGFADRLRNVRVCCGDWKRVCGPSVTFRHGMTGVFCMHPDTLLRTEDERMVRVDDLRVGERIAPGRTVLDKFIREHVGEMLSIRVQGLPEPLRLTGEHRIMVIPGRAADTRQDYRSDECLWASRQLLAASDVKVGDYLLVPLGGMERDPSWQWRSTPKLRGSLRAACFRPSKKLYRAIGYYAAEGHIQYKVRTYGRVPSCVIWTFNIAERDTYVADLCDCIRDCFGVEPKVWQHYETGSLKVKVGSVALSEFMSRYVPGTATSKYLHPDLMTAPTRMQRELLIGWSRGDGGCELGDRNKCKLSVTTASMALASQMFTVAIRCGLRPSFKRRQRHYDVYFASEDAAYLGRSVPAKSFRSSRRIIAGHSLARVRAIEKFSYAGPVIDIDVDGDDLFAAPFALIHNCDPPYADTAKRTKGLYATDCEKVAHDVREWAIEQGKNPLMRICLAGYSEHEEVLAHGWTAHEWQAVGGYGLISGDEDGLGRENRSRERLYFSPHCVTREEGLFDSLDSHTCGCGGSNE